MWQIILKIQFLKSLNIFQLTITNKGDAEVVGLAIVNTIIGGCGGGISCLFLFWFYKEKKWSFLTTLNGALTGNNSQFSIFHQKHFSKNIFSTETI